MKKIYCFLIIVGIFSSCGEYAKALKSTSPEVKLAYATKQYEVKKYNRALRIFEQLAPAFRGKPQSEDMFFLYAQAYFKTKQYRLAGYQFESFVASFPKSDRLEEASFLAAQSYAMLTLEFSLDQADTMTAIGKLQDFIDTYPNSKHITEANKQAQVLQIKVEKKAFEIAKGYNLVSDYKAALVVFDNFLIDFPGTPFKDEALYYKLDSAYQLAINSIDSKKQERLIAAKTIYNTLLKSNPNSPFKNKADKMLANIESSLSQYNK
jgi:outer membrane protein assembly factor BamD